ncbi:hypothetical protein [Sphingomonas mollis]|uniref:Uncharacterized protein n=1 Tax=Sphingomonas mollis TaxID=2795726 RepID=A0ABS0XLI5_9SPHN|nr:hypothetical protein [Sphingomonas sp. BT553]MBJ6120893.1 hypothetical protein [Sphingomonas sp. BT553]
MNTDQITEILAAVSMGEMTVADASQRLAHETGNIEKSTAGEAYGKWHDALRTARDYVADAAKGKLTYEDSGEGFAAMAREDLPY